MQTLYAYFERIKNRLNRGDLTISTIQHNYIGKKDNIIGSGTNGLIVKHNSEKKAIKLLYVSKCSDAKLEYNLHMSCFQGLSTAKNIIGHNYQVKIAMAYSFCKSCEIIFNKKEYNCVYEMELIDSIAPLYTNYNPDSDSNELHHIWRFFLHSSDLHLVLSRIPSNIKKNINNLKDILFRMGILFGSSIFYSRLLPFDGEYVLAYDSTHNELVLQLLDFGMFEKINIPIAVEEKKIYIKELTSKIKDEIYISFHFPKLFASFYNGVKIIFDTLPSSMFNENDKINNEIIMGALAKWLN